MPNRWNHGRAAARDSEQLIIIREMATAGRQIHAADQILNGWNHGRAAAGDSEQLINIGEQIGDSCSWETDPRGGSDTGQLELWTKTRRQQL